MYAYHCDRDGCETWQRCDSSTPMFLQLMSAADPKWVRHFCTPDCLMHWAAANSEPTVMQ